jgi:ribose transport system permease protein
LNPFVATLAVGQIVAGVARYIRGPVPQFTRVPARLTERARWNALGLSTPLIVAVVLTVVISLALRSTVAGRHLVASSASRPAATLIGLRALRYRVLTFVASSLLAGIGAVLLAGQLGAPDLSLGSPYLLATVVAVVLSGAVLSGGRVDLVGVALGAVFITVLNHDLRVQGYSTGFAQLAQAVVLGGGLAAVYIVRNRSALWSAIASGLRLHKTTRASATN